MITKQQAANLPRGTTLHHVSLRNTDGSPLRARVNGRTQTWITRPDEWRLPMKHGLKHCFYITERSAAEWTTGDQQ